MKVILLKEVPKLGSKGDIKEVNDGYARNYLIPSGLVEMLTKYTLDMFEAQQKKKTRSKKQEARSKKGMAKRIKDKEFIIEAKADKKGTLYAGLDQKAVAKELNKEKYKIEAGEIILKEAIKKIGDYDIKLNLAGEMANIKLKVKSEK